MSNPIVSVVILTYNHYRFFPNAIEGILKQASSYSYEIVIGDDCSNDGTSTLIESYSKRFSSLIRVRRNNTNLGMLINTQLTIRDCKGKYYTICEGDDFWTDSSKLQRQVDFLEANPDYAMVATDIVLVDGDGNILPDNAMVIKQRSLRKEEIGFFDLLQTNLINTVTVCVRSDIIKELALEAETRNLWYAIDKWFWLNIALKHKIKLFYDKTAAYRIHPGGVTRSPDFLHKRAGLIYLDVIKKMFRLKRIKDLSKQECLILSRRCTNLIFKGNIGFWGRVYLASRCLQHPKLILASIRANILSY